MTKNAPVFITKAPKFEKTGADKLSIYLGIATAAFTVIIKGSELAGILKKKLRERREKKAEEATEEKPQEETSTES